MSPWIYLLIAIAFEIAATLCLKASDGFARLPWAAGSVACYGACFIAFAATLRSIPVGIAYAVWAGVGIVAVAALGTVLFGDRINAVQLGFISLIVIGSVGLRLTTP